MQERPVAAEQLLLGSDPTRAMSLAALADSATYMAEVVQQAGIAPNGPRIPIIHEDPEQRSSSPIRGLTAADRKRSVAGALCLTEGLALMANRCPPCLTICCSHARFYQPQSMLHVLACQV